MSSRDICPKCGQMYSLHVDCEGKELGKLAREKASPRRLMKYDLIPSDEAMELEFIEGYKAGFLEAKQRMDGVETALRNWIEWEREQIKREGPYAGRAINELIRQGEAALK